ncbi:hypothetical protein F4861DRAFT_126034 [Xylaria intraflava]|nr:hypothetical protein F4861DRAFT_126034 [Xylaria intraflava]
MDVANLLRSSPALPASPPRLPSPPLPPSPSPSPPPRSEFKARGRKRKPPKPGAIIRRSYKKRRKVEVLLFIQNHRIPLEYDRLGYEIRPSGSQILAGAPPVEEGFRRPYLREASAYFGVPVRTIANWWAAKDKIFGPHTPKRSPKKREVAKPEGTPT